MQQRLEAPAGGDGIGHDASRILVKPQRHADKTFDMCEPLGMPFRGREELAEMLLFTTGQARFHRSTVSGPTRIGGGVGKDCVRDRQRCSTFLCRLTYSDFRGWYCTTTSSSSQQRALM